MNDHLRVSILSSESLLLGLAVGEYQELIASDQQTSFVEVLTSRLTLWGDEENDSLFGDAVERVWAPSEVEWIEPECMLGSRADDPNVFYFDRDDGVFEHRYHQRAEKSSLDRIVSVLTPYLELDLTAIVQFRPSGERLSQCCISFFENIENETGEKWTTGTEQPNQIFNRISKLINDCGSVELFALGLDLGHAVALLNRIIQLADEWFVGDGHACELFEQIRNATNQCESVIESIVADRRIQSMHFVENALRKIGKTFSIWERRCGFDELKLDDCNWYIGVLRDESKEPWEMLWFAIGGVLSVLSHQSAETV